MKKKLLLYVGIVLAFLLLSYGFVPQVLGGKIVNQSDISGWTGMAHEASSWNATHPDNHTHWTGSMFSGMPTISMMAEESGDWTATLYNLLLTGKRPATYFFISLLGAFLLMLSLGISPWVAFGGAIAVTFCSYNPQIVQVGHNTKMQALAFLPWVLAALIFTLRSACREGAGNWKSWLPRVVLGSALFALALSFQIKAHHPQISYYLAIMIVIYVIVMLIWLLTDKERRTRVGRFIVAGVLLLVLGLIGIGTNATKLLPTTEYTPYSMRGGTTATKEDGSRERKGLDISYATAWSYGWEELPNLVIPNYNGGSSSGAVNPKKSETIKLLKRAGQNNLKEISKNLPLYWGPQPFTAGPMYMGAITVFLFILGLMYYRGKEKWWVVAATVFAVLLALGNHFLGFTKLCFAILPLYNKFRTVSMALVVLQFTLPVLACLMLDNIVKSDENPKDLSRKVLRGAGVTLGLILVLALAQSLFGSFSSDSDIDALGEVLAADRKSLLWSDTLRSLLFVAGAAAALLWGLSIPKNAQKTFETQPAMVRGRRTIAVIMMCLLVLGDLFFAGNRYLNADDFTTPRNFKGQFAQRKVDEIILRDTDPSYRVLDLTVNIFNDSHPSYWHKNIGGYSPAKLQIYQEYIESHLQSEISQLSAAIGKCSTVAEAQSSLPYLPGLAALNCRYIIVGADNAPLRYRYAKGNAWFEGGAQGSIEMTSYAPNELQYRYSSATGGKAVFSEVYYPAGWVARLEDGTQLDINLSDEVLRSINLPAGQHTLTMSFQPESYRKGKALSCGCSIAIILLVLLSVAGSVYFKKQEDERG